MKEGRSLIELAQELERQKTTKRDFIAPGKAMVAKSNGHTEIEIGDGLKMAVGETAHENLATKLDIPKKYYDRMRSSAPALLDANLNHWLQSQRDSYMVRTLDGKVRAVLSDKYRALDNADLAEAVIPVLMQRELMVLSCEVSERRMYIKAVDKRIEKDIPSGAKMGNGHVIFDTLSPAITITNSEMGCGALAVQTSIWTKQCTNMATFSERSVRKYHTGSRLGQDDAMYELLSDNTRRLTDAALWSQVRDLVVAAFDKVQFDALANQLAEAAGQKIEADPVKVVEVTAKRFLMQEAEKTSVLQHLIQGGDLTRYGLFNAVTRTAEDLESYDRASEFEKIGGSIIELPKSDWQRIAVAA